MRRLSGLPCDSGSQSDGIDVGEFERAATIDQGQRVFRAESAQVDERLAVATVRIIFRRRITDKGRQLAQTFDRGIGALLLQDFGGIDRDRQRRFRLRSRDVGTGHDDALGYRFGPRRALADRSDGDVAVGFGACA